MPITGIDLYRAYNLARTAQGNPWADAVPVHGTKAANDQIYLTSAMPYEITWTRDAAAPAASYTALIYLSASASAPFSFNGTRKMRLLGTVDLMPTVPVGIDTLLASSNKFWIGGIINIAAAIAESGDCPFTLAYLSFTFLGL